MRTHWTGALMALLTLSPGVAAAQQGEKSPAPPTTRYRVRQMTPDRLALTLTDRPRLGLTLTNDSATKSQGARVADVMEDSPAAKAGIREGDIITKLNGQSIGGDDPSGKLAELAQKLEVGDTAKLEYKRDGKTMNATLVAADLGGARWAMGMPMTRNLERLQMDMPRGWAGPDGDMSRTFTFFGGRPMGLDLVEMNSGLGEYFGTSTGLLVTDTPRDSTMPLRAGDVILSIDGRTPTSEAHAARILGSYNPGETVKFEIMRKKSRQSVTWTVPERNGPGGEMREMRRGVRIERS
ncbi:MAG TPA: PDZ domain-containing protein [Gemmatimonadales bacterium]|jgi:S1-C subfamily serine protease|nr:PDZ domain-containing protein [Gemmatimonadales bacterium]